MKYLHILFASVLFLIFSCDNDKNPTQFDNNDETDDYQIYQKVLIDRYGETNCHIILSDSTGYFNLDTNHISNIKDKIENILSETIDNYFTVNVNRKKLKNIPGIDFYTFESEYQGGYENTVEVGLSDVGYNKLKTQAIVTFTEIYNSFGGGILVFLEKEADDWIISYYYGVFIIG